MNSIELRDIHLPDSVSWWPLAPGWWILLLLIIILIMVSYYLIPRLIKRLKHQPARKLATHEFEQIQQNYQSQKNKQALIQAVSILLRRVAMTYDSRIHCASLTGEAWKHKLSSINPHTTLSDESIHSLLHAPYQSRLQFDADKLLAECETWIKTLPSEAQR